MIHVAESRLKECSDGVVTKDLIDSCVSVLVLYLRHPTAIVTLQQKNIVNRLRDVLEFDNIHTPSGENNGNR